VYRITGARLGVPEDVAGRQRRYLVSMGVRTACFVLAIVASGWLRWLLIVGAVVLPYVSVVFANGGREQGGDFPGEATQRRALSGSHEDPGPRPDEPPAA